MITIRYFASLREALGRDQDSVDAASVATVGDCWIRVTDRPAVKPDVLAAVNMEYAGFEHPVSDGDEVAFFPPVTGG
ncbi:MAG: MoaD/ThiS family protein [Gammaproteobacteria bacterium]|nr:MoaD/ThiS family protein [Gammaproteobacteria bacterium]